MSITIALLFLACVSAVAATASLAPYVDENFREQVCRRDEEGWARPGVALFDSRGLLTYNMGGEKRLRWLVALAFKYRLQQMSITLSGTTYAVTSADVSIDGMNLDFDVTFDNGQVIACGAAVTTIEGCDDENTTDGDDEDTTTEQDDRKRDVDQAPTPCWMRRSQEECMGSCSTTSGAVTSVLLQDCDCLWDYPRSDTMTGDTSGSVDPPVACPTGQVCCFNLPCELAPQVDTWPASDPAAQAAFCDARGGGGVDPVTMEPVISNCAYSATSPFCSCRSPLTSLVDTFAAFINANGGIDQNVTAPLDIVAPFDCYCKFATDSSPADWLAETAANGIAGVDNGGCIATPGNIKTGMINEFVAVLADFIEETNRQAYLRQCEFVRINIFLRLAGDLGAVVRQFINQLKEQGVPARLVAKDERHATVITPASKANKARRQALLIDPEVFEVSEVVDAAAPLDDVDVVDAKTAPAGTVALSVLLSTVALVATM